MGLNLPQVGDNRPLNKGALELPQTTNERSFQRIALRDTEFKKVAENELVPGLTAELEAKLVQLALRMEDENYVTWRFLFRIFLEAQSYWKDQQYGYYDFQSDLYRTSTQGSNFGRQDTRSSNANLNFQFVTNIYRAFGWTVISVLGQHRPSVVFLPQDYTNEDDVISARAAQDVVPIIERANNLSLLHMKACLWLYTDGIALGYVRHIIDGERFGYHKRKVIRMVSSEILPGEKHYLCPECGHFQSESKKREESERGIEPNLSGILDQFPSNQPMEINERKTPMNSLTLAGRNLTVQKGYSVARGPLKSRLNPPLYQPARVEGATQIGGTFSGYPKSGYVPRGTREAGLENPDRQTIKLAKRCENCGAPLSSQDLYSEPFESPEVVGVERTPRGQEVIDIYSGLESRLPPWIYQSGEYPFLSLQHEVHVSALRATYGERAKNVVGGTAGPYDTWDRFARLLLTEPHGGSYYSLANQNLVTEKKYWLRPSLFYMLEEDSREKLLSMFPDGVYISFEGVGNRLLDARRESIDDHFAVCHALEGPGNYTPSIGASCISIQKRYNTIHNFIMEWVEYAAAGQGTFVNAGLISVDALRRQRRAPGMIYPLRLPPTIPIGNALLDSRPGAISNDIFVYGQQLVQLGQMVTGAVPTVSGGTEKSLRPTTYLTDREQALGRLYVPWQHLRHFWAKIMLLAVKEFARSRSEDERYTIQGPDHSEINKIVHLDSLQGDFDAYPEVNEDFPRLLHQQQAVFMSLLNSPDGTIRQILGDPRNLPYVKTLFGWPDIFVPGEDDILKQKREIARLLLTQPIPQPSPTGQPVFAPSIPPDEFADNHALHAEIVKAWAVSGDGIRNMQENPQGYANVLAHGRAHQQLLAQAQQAAAQGAVQQELAKESAKIGAAQVATKQVTQKIGEAQSAGAKQSLQQQAGALAQAPPAARPGMPPI